MPAARTHCHVVCSALLCHVVDPQLLQPLLGCFKGLALLLKVIDAPKPPASFLRQPLVPAYRHTKAYRAVCVAAKLPFDAASRCVQSTASQGDYR